MNYFIPSHRLDGNDETDSRHSQNPFSLYLGGGGKSVNDEMMKRHDLKKLGFKSKKSA